jgi:broad specificity phosphatase PhoE
MRLLLAPHAPTDWNAVGRYQGHTDTTLSAVGRRQAALLADRLANQRIDEVHSSDLRRALETASAVCEPRRLPLRFDARLRELHFGAWEGLTYGEVQTRYAEPMNAWETDPLRTAPPGGETLAQLATRVGAFLSELTDEPGTEKTKLVVAHRGSLRVLVCLALDLPPEIRSRFHLVPASLSELNIDSKGAVLTSLNDVHHLRETAHVG